MRWGALAMPSLSETQAEFRRAVVDGAVPTPAMLIAPAPAGLRLAIYRRHHRESLIRHLAGRHPTLDWLVGTPRFVALAEQFIRSTPPSAPCMAEYGDGFPAWLEEQAPVGLPPYLADTARLDWLLGNAAVAIDGPALAIDALSAWPADRLPDLGLRLQPGAGYLRSGWPIDDLVRIRLDNRATEQLEFMASPVRLEIRGARGQFGIHRLDEAEFRFRAGLRSGASLGAAIEGGLSADPEFDVASAIATLFATGLVAGVASPDME